MLGLSFSQALAALALLRLAAASLPPPTSTAFEYKRAEPTRLDARQNNDGVTITITIAPDSTCGYLSRWQTISITCVNGSNCSWGSWPYGFILCGNANKIRTRCYPREEALDETLCDEACRNNNAILKCTFEEAKPYCATFGYPDGVRGYHCDTSATLEKADFTSSGQTGRTFETTVLVDEEAQPTSTTTTAEPTSTTETTEPTPTTETTESTEAPRTTSTKSESSSAQTQTKTSSGNNGGSAPAGAIVGGVVGGLAVVTMLILGVLFLRRGPPKDDSAAPAIDRNSTAMQQAIGPPPIPFSAGVTELSSPATVTPSKHLAQASSLPHSDMRTPPMELQTDGIMSQGNVPQWETYVVPMPGSPPHEVEGDSGRGQH